MQCILRRMYKHNDCTYNNIIHSMCIHYVMLNEVKSFTKIEETIKQNHAQCATSQHPGFVKSVHRGDILVSFQAIGHDLSE